MPRGKQKTHEEFVEELREKSPTVVVKGQYVKGTIPIDCMCSVCGHTWRPAPKTLLKGIGCPSCANNIKLTHNEFLDRLSRNNPHYLNFEIISEYSGMSHPVTCKCRNCGTTWTAKANDLVRAGSGCPRCAGAFGYTHDQFLRNLKERNKQYDIIEILSQYKGSAQHIQCKCKNCGFEWTPLASSLLQGTGCPECAKARVAQKGKTILVDIPRPGPISHEEYVEKLHMQNPAAHKIELLTRYTGAQDSVRCKCKICGHEWETKAATLVRGTGCPYCSHASTSFMEQFILCALQRIWGQERVCNRDKTAIGLELDIYLPQLGYAIEIGSWKWHSRTLENDIRKAELCLQNGITLITIYDSVKSHIEDSKYVWHYYIELRTEPNLISLKKIVHRCLNTMGISHTFTDADWHEIEYAAHNAAYRISHDEFVQKLKKRNKHFEKITLLSQYTGAVNKIRCLCVDCGHIWETAASELLKGTGCPKCQIKKVGKAKSKRDSIIAWRKANPNGTKLQCERETGISRMTVNKWWEDND